MRKKSDSSFAVPDRCSHLSLVSEIDSEIWEQLHFGSSEAPNAAFAPETKEYFLPGPVRTFHCFRRLRLPL